MHGWPTGHEDLLRLEVIVRYSDGPLLVAIPARDEEEHIDACLEALAGQRGAVLDGIVLLVNDTTDNTEAVARRVRLPTSTSLHLLRVDLPLRQRSAGHARRLAIDHALSLAGDNGALLTTDADGQVDEDWLVTTIDLLRGGVDAVAGWVELLPADWGALPPSLHEDDAREAAYDQLCDSIHAMLDPDPHDPQPRHTQHSGASLAVTAQAYRRAGGIPAVACGEDRAFVSALRRVDCRLRHSLEVHAFVSGRTVGRAVRGMAETIRRRLISPDLLLDDRLEPALVCARRAWARGLLRRARSGGSEAVLALAENLSLDVNLIEHALRAPYFGMAWEGVEALSPRLRRQSVAVQDLSNEIAVARTILAQPHLVAAS